MSSETIPVTAVSVSDLNAYGCPSCGFRSGYTPISGGGAAVWICGDEQCGAECCVLADGVTESSIGFGDYYPVLSKHPREGISAHGTADTSPEGGGEHFYSRGVGLDGTPGCFVCGGDPGLYHNIAAFVKTNEAGERVVAMFQHGARLDYRSFEPDRVQVKIGACSEHEANLHQLNALTEKDETITPEMVQEAIG